MLRFFDKDGVDIETAMTLEQFIENKIFEEEFCFRGSRALVQLRNWVMAVWDYITGEELAKANRGGEKKREVKEEEVEDAKVEEKKGSEVDMEEEKDFVVDAR